MRKIQDISVSFRIAVNADRTRILELLGKNKAAWEVSFKETELISPKYFSIGRNTVEITYNEDYDEKFLTAQEDGYLYYKSHMDFYPKDDRVTLAGQIQLAKEISKKFADAGIASEIIAEFEHLL